jgi:hypothetical protein
VRGCKLIKPFGELNCSLADAVLGQLWGHSYRVLWSVNSLVPFGHSGLAPADDEALVSLWLSLKISAHTRRAYSSEASRFLEFVRKPLASVTLTDLQAWAETLGQRSPASQNRALTAVKSLLSFAHETGYLPFNVGIAVKLRPNRDSLAQRILEESEKATLVAG